MRRSTIRKKRSRVGGFRFPSFSNTTTQDTTAPQPSLMNRFSGLNLKERAANVASSLGSAASHAANLVGTGVNELGKATRNILQTDILVSGGARKTKRRRRRTIK